MNETQSAIITIEERLEHLEEKIDKLINILTPKNNLRNNFSDVLKNIPEETLRSNINEFILEQNFNILIESIFCNDPKNFCCYITDKERKKGMIYENNKWSTIDSKILCRKITDEVLKLVERQDRKGYNIWKNVNHANTPVELNMLKTDLSNDIEKLLHSMKSIIKCT